MKHTAKSTHAAPNAVMEVDIKNAYNGTEFAGLEQHFATLHGVKNVHLDRTSGMAHLSYDPAQTTPNALEKALQGGGTNCDCTHGEDSAAQPGHPCVGKSDSHGQSTTAGVSPATLQAPEKLSASHAGMSAEDHAKMSVPSKAAPPTEMAGMSAEDHAKMSGGDHKMSAADHAKMGGDEHAGHGKAMVDDLLRRFIVSIVLAIPVIAFSPMGALIGLPAMPPFGLSMGLWGFFLATPVVCAGRLAFHFGGGARAAARRSQHDDTHRAGHPRFLRLLRCGDVFHQKRGLLRSGGDADGVQSGRALAGNAFALCDGKSR